MKNLFEIIVLATIVIGLSLMIGESYDTESEVITITETYDTVAEDEYYPCDCDCDTCYESYLEDEMIPHCTTCEEEYATEGFTQEQITVMQLEN